jgi:pectinesterase
MKTIYLQQGQTINSVLNQENNNNPLTIILIPGVYHERLCINRDNLTIIGNNSVITSSIYALMLDINNNPLTTFRTETIKITGNNVVLDSLTIKNESGFGKNISQAVALSILGNNTRVVNCTLSAYQDTLFIGPFPRDLQVRYIDMLPPIDLLDNDTYSTFINTKIIGNVDFIFGSGIALFYECEIISNGNGYIFAPSHSLDKPYGFITYNTTFKSLSSDYNVILARPWRDYGSIFLIKSNFLTKFNDNLFDSWNNKETRFYLDPFIPSSLSKEINEYELDKVTQFVNAKFQVKLK